MMHSFWDTTSILSCLKFFPQEVGGWAVVIFPLQSAHPPTTHFEVRSLTLTGHTLSLSRRIAPDVKKFALQCVHSDDLVVANTDNLTHLMCSYFNECFMCVWIWIGMTRTSTFIGRWTCLRIVSRPWHTRIIRVWGAKQLFQFLRRHLTAKFALCGQTFFFAVLVWVANMFGHWGDLGEDIGRSEPQWKQISFCEFFTVFGQICV